MTGLCCTGLVPPLFHYPVYMERRRHDGEYVRTLLHFEAVRNHMVHHPDTRVIDPACDATYTCTAGIYFIHPPQFPAFRKNRFHYSSDMKKYSKEDQRLLAIWAIDCAERVVPLFEAVCPQDDRPRMAIEIGREWVRTGIFSMPIIRGASLAAHAAAKDVAENASACCAAHAAGQAVATAHVPQHAYGGAYYALKALAASDPENAERNIARERAWQSQHLPEHLRQEIMSRLIVEKRKRGLVITVQKGPGF